jgi:hypothetical protein
MSTCRTLMAVRIGDHAAPGLKRAYGRAMSSAAPVLSAPLALPARGPSHLPVLRRGPLAGCHETRAGTTRPASRADGADHVRGAHCRATAAPPRPPAAGTGGAVVPLRGRDVRARLPGYHGGPRRPGPGAVRPGGGIPAAAGARVGARPVPPGEPAQHAAVRRLSRLRLETVADLRRVRPLPQRIRVGRTAAGPGLRPRLVAGTRAGVRARVDPLPGAARAAPR